MLAGPPLTMQFIRLSEHMRCLFPISILAARFATPMKSHILLLLALHGLSCQAVPDDISSIESDMLPTFYIEGEEPAPATIEARMEHHNVPGLSVAVYREGRLAWAKGYGFADEDSNRPVTPETLFQAASISKPVAAMAVLDMAEEGLVSLDEDVNSYLSSWHLEDNEFTAEEKVTLRRILNHSAGTTVWGFGGYARSEEVPSAVDVVRGLGNTDSVSVFKAPGESWRYSGGGYTVMQIAISDVAGRPFEDVLDDRVIEPLSMTSSTYKQPLPEHLHDMAATGYRHDRSAVEGKWHVYPEQAAAGLWSTPTDIGKFAVAIQQALAGTREDVLTQATTREMLTPGDNDQGLGPGIRIDGSHFGHGGANEGFRGDFIASKEGGYAVAVMTNSDRGSPLISELIQAIFRHYDWSSLEPTIKSTIDFSEDRMAAFAGSYSIPDVGDLTLAVEDGQLVVKAGDLITARIILRAENDSTWFDASDGTTFHFTIRAGLAESFVVQGLTAQREG